MRIVQILPELNGGGLERSALDLALELARLGHESIVISNGGELVSRLTLRGCRHIAMPVHKKPLVSLQLVGRLRRQLQELEPDVIHARSPVSTRIAYLAWKGLPENSRPRLVTSVHGLYKADSYRAVITAGEPIIAVSEYVANQLEKNHGKKLRHPPQVIHRGVNTREFDRASPVSGQWQLRLLNSYPQLEGKHWLLMPARLAPEKGQGTFLQMLAAMAREREDIFGLIVGEADPGKEKYARQLEQMALDLGLSDKVLFLGQRRDMRELYASSQITYNLSEYPESSGRAVTEALAMNCPVVAYSDGSPAEVVRQCFPQGLVERDSIPALVEVSLQALERPQSIDFSGFSLTETAEQTLALYRKLRQSA